MKKLIIILMVLLSIGAEAKKEFVRIGYTVYVNELPNKSHTTIQIFNPDHVDEVVNKHLDQFGIEFQVENVLENTNMWDMKTHVALIYVEKKLIYRKKNGKYVSKRFTEKRINKINSLK